MWSVLPGIFGIYASYMNHCYLGFHCWLLTKYMYSEGDQGSYLPWPPWPPKNTYMFSKSYTPPYQNSWICPWGRPCSHPPTLDLDLLVINMCACILSSRDYGLSCTNITLVMYETSKCHCLDFQCGPYKHFPRKFPFLVYFIFQCENENQGIAFVNIFACLCCYFKSLCM